MDRILGLLNQGEDAVKAALAKGYFQSCARSQSEGTDGGNVSQQEILEARVIREVEDTDPGLTRGFGGLRVRVVDLRAGIAGAAGSGLSQFPSPDYESPSRCVPVNHSSYFSNEFIGACLGDSKRPGGVPHRGWPAVIDLNWVSHAS